MSKQSLLRRQKSKKNESVRGMMATYPARKTQLLNSIDSIIDQVQDLFIYLNNYSIGEYEELRNSLPEKCRLLLGENEAGNLMDSGKFFMSDKVPGFHLALDDDLIYPPDFVQCMVRTHRKLSRGNAPLALGVHGRKIHAFPMHSYFKDTETFYFGFALKHHTEVNILGTGGLLYHSDDLKMSFKRCESPGMADIWFAITCLNQGVKRYVIARPNAWVQQQPVENSLYQQYRDNDWRQTELLNRIDWGTKKEAQEVIMRRNISR